jgi:hypothetical protein
MCQDVTHIQSLLRIPSVLAFCTSGLRAKPSLALTISLRRENLDEKVEYTYVCKLENVRNTVIFIFPLF